MKIKDEFIKLPKQDIYDMYWSIVYDYKDYEKITRSKMIDEIIKQEEESYIFNLLTAKELDFLNLFINNKINKRDYKKYSWEIKTLNKKCIFSLISFDIFEEQKENVKNALNQYKLNKKIKQKNDELFTFIIGMVRTNGNILYKVLEDISKEIFQLKADFKYILSNPLVHFYCDYYYEYIDSIQENEKIVFYRKYFEILDDLDEGRKEFGVAGQKNFYLDEYIDMFYYGFPIKKPSVKKMFETLHIDDFDSNFYYIEEARVLYNRYLINTLNSKEKSKIICDALDDSPCSVMNGLTPNEFKKEKEKQLKVEFRRVKQEGANLSTKDADLFYKLYFALLDYANKKYKINTNIEKIYEQKFLDAQQLLPINDYLFEHKSIITNFLIDNPYKFNKDELKIIEGFKSAIKSDFFIVIGFEKEYTQILGKDNKIYMVKGIRDNLDNILKTNKLPIIISTTLLMFKDKIIYNSFLSISQIDFGNSLKELLLSDIKNSEKCYRL